MILDKQPPYKWLMFRQYFKGYTLCSFEIFVRCDFSMTIKTLLSNSLFDEDMVTKNTKEHK